MTGRRTDHAWYRAALALGSLVATLIAFCSTGYRQSLAVADGGDFTDTGAPACVDTIVPILMYHYLVDAESPPTEYFVTKDLFERQMAALNAYGYETVTLEDFMAYRDGSVLPPDHPVILTFDDGHESVYTLARPILVGQGQLHHGLREQNMTATLFVTTGFIGESEEERQGGWMVWDPEILSLYEDGFPIESHSVTHPNLTEIPEEQAWQELVDSRQDIEDHLGNSVGFFAYPGGHGAYDPAIRGLVQEAGYEAALAAWPDGLANPATSDIWALPRVMIREIHSLDLDPEHPENLFLRKLNPDFPLPAISNLAHWVLHEDGARGSCIYPGETITVTVEITNGGVSVMAGVRLRLDDDAEHEEYYYEHLVTEQLDHGETDAMEFVLTLQGNLGLGLHTCEIALFDEHMVVGYANTGWQPAFLLADGCYDSYLPASFQGGYQSGRDYRSDG